MARQAIRRITRESLAIKGVVQCVVLAVALVWLPDSVQAQAFPTGPISVVVPLAPGDAADIAARARDLLSHARWLAERLDPQTWGLQRQAVSVHANGPATIKIISWAEHDASA